jgi:CRISPR-associated endonuclease/helicase Cas3
MEHIAHINKKIEGIFEVQSLNDHLTGTSSLTSQFAASFNNSAWGRLVGLWHDLGSIPMNFRSILKVNSGYEEDDQKRPKTDHTSAAAILAKEMYPNLFWQPVAYCIAGHHAGLHNYIHEPSITGDLSDRLKKQEYLDKIRSKIPNELLEKINLNPPTGKPIDSKQMHLWIRMLFSCLVDADYLDTERFMNPESFERRGKYDSLIELKGRFDIHMEEMVKNAPLTTVNTIRSKILGDCIESGEFHPDSFQLQFQPVGAKHCHQWHGHWFMR